jgi:YVTN family beta-propeller protein
MRKFTPLSKTVQKLTLFIAMLVSLQFANAQAVITADAATGSISACFGNASVTPSVQQFTASGTGLTADITVTAAADFEVSTIAASGYGTSLTLTQSGSTVASTIIYIRSAATAASGAISGNITLASTGATSVLVATTGTVNATPTVNPITNQSICNNTATSAVAFTGAVAGTVFNWTNNTAAIGLAASGTGNIASFTATNTSSSAVTATITVTPTSRIAFAYIANYYSGNVSVINTTSNTVVATVAVGVAPQGVSASSDGSRVYVTNNGSNTVSVINTATNTVVATVAVGAGPTGVSVSPDGTKVYVANHNVVNNVSVINTTTNTVVATVAVGGAPTGVSVSPDGSRVYVANSTSNDVSVINTATNTVVATIAVGGGPTGVTVSPNGSRVYVANNTSNTVSVINTATNTVVATAAVSLGSPYGVSVSPTGNRVYVASNNTSNKASVINTTINTVISAVNVGSFPYGVSVSPDGSRLYVANFGSNNVSVINTTNLALLATVAVGSGPSSLGNFIANVPSCVGTAQIFSITVNPSSDATIATVNKIQTLPVTGITYFSNDCTDALIAKLSPNGASPVSGNTTATIWIETTQPTQFVKRHYEITPPTATGAATATSNVTLYFTQEEFDDYNTVNLVKLPTTPADAAGIANLLIEKRSGVSNDGTGLPPTYTGSIISINPADVDVIWNATASRWEVSFDVAGFSGFFVKTQAVPLPLTLLSFTATKQPNDNVLLQWLTTNEINLKHFELERSINVNSFQTIGTIAAENNNYQLTDKDAWTSDVRYYRLKFVDNDGGLRYSNIVGLSNKQQSNISIYPNPVSNIFIIQFTDNRLLKSTATLVDVSGKLVKLILLTNIYQTVDIANLANGIYLLKFENGVTEKIIKQ